MVIKKYLLVIFSLLFILLSGCSEKPKQTIKFADVGWDSVKFHNAVAGYIGEVVYGYQVQEIPGSSPIIHQAIINGEVDVNMEAWTDNLSTYNHDLQKGLFQELSINFEDNNQGFYVPQYVIDEYPQLKTVKDLANYAFVFKDIEDENKGRIYGAIPGWEVNEIMRNKVNYYGLDKFYNYFQPGSDAALSAAFTSAYEKKEPIVGYYWEPTWLMGKYDLVLLEDEPYIDEKSYKDGKTACPSVVVTVVASNDFCKANQDYCEFLSKYKTSSNLTSEALSHMQDTSDNYQQTAKWFLIEHQDLLDQWLSPTQKQLLLESLGINSQNNNWLFNFPAFLSFDIDSFDNNIKQFAADNSSLFSFLTSGLTGLINFVQRILMIIPYWLLLLVVGFIGFKTSKKIYVGILYVLLLTFIGGVGYWSLMLETLSIVIVAVIISLILGFPLGILIANNNRVNQIMRPILDAMQTMPVFVYLIPALLFFGLGKAPAVIATTIYAVVPMIRMTNLGIRQVDSSVIEAAKAFGATSYQTLFKVQIPQAKATILQGVNQTIMMAMAMVVTCSMIGATGLGMEVLISVNRIQIGRGLIAGASIVIIAIILDRITQSFVKKENKDDNE